MAGLIQPRGAQSPHDNDEHEPDMAVDGEEQPPEPHDNKAHKETYLTDADVDGISEETAEEIAIKFAVGL